MADTSLHTDYVILRPVTYDVIVLDDDAETRTSGYAEVQAYFEAEAIAGAAGRSSAARHRWAAGQTVLDVGTPADRYGVTSTADLRPLTAAGQIAVVGTDPAGHQTYPVGVLLTRTDAEERMRALRAGGMSVQVIPEAQLVPV